MSFSNSNSESFGVKNNLQTYGNSLIQKNRLKNLDPNTVRIGLIDPNIAQTWAERVLSDGTTVMSIKKGDTINHTTSQPIATGLFCQRIFGPCTDYTCACGHEKIRVHLNVNVSNPVCPECHVEWTESSVRRQRLGSISLLSPVTHKWFSDSRNYIPILTGITVKTFRTLKECKLFFPFPFQKDYTSSSLFPSGSSSILPIKKGNNTLHIRATKNLQFLLESNVGQKTPGSRGRTLEGYPKALGPYPKAFLTKHLTRRSTPLIATELIESTGQPVDKLKNTIGQQDQNPLEPLVQQFALEQDQRDHRPLVPNSLKGQRAFGFKSFLMEPKEKQRMPKTQDVVTLKAKISEIKTHSTPMENSQGLALHVIRGQTQKNRIFFKKVSNGSKPVVSKANNDQLTYKKILKQNLKTKLFNYLNNNCLNIKNILFNWSIFVSESCILDNKGHELLVRSITAANKAHEEKVLGPLVHFKKQKNLSKKKKKPEFNLNENFLSFLSQKGKFINREVEILGLDYKKSQNLYFFIATAEILKQKNCTKLLSSLSTRKGSHKTKTLSKQLNHNQSFGHLKYKSISKKGYFIANGVFAGGLSLPLTRVAKKTPNTLSGTSSTDFTGLGSKDTFYGSTSFSKGPNILTLSPPNVILAKHQKQEESTTFLRSSLALEIYKKFGLNSNLIIKESLKFSDFSLNLEIIAWTIKKRLYCAKKLRTLSNLWSTRNEIDFNDNCYNKNIQKVNNLVIENNYSSPLPFVTNISQKKVIQNFCYNTTNLNRKLLFNNLLPFNKKSEKIEFGTLLATLVLDQSRYGEGSSPPLWYTAQRVNHDQPMPLKQHKVDKGNLEEKKNQSNNVFVTEKLFSSTSSTVGNLGPLDQKQVINTNTGFSLKASESPKAKSVGRDKGVSSGKGSTGLWPKQELKSIQKEKKKNNKRKVALRSCFNLATCSTMPQMLPSYGRLQTVSKPKEVKAWSKGLSPQVPKELPKGQVGMGAPTIVLTPQDTSFGQGTAFGRFGPVKDKTSNFSLREQTKGISYDSNFEKKRVILEKHSPKKWTKVVLNKELSFWISFSSKKYKTKAITLAKLKFKSAKTKGFISNYNSLLVCSSVERDKTFYTSSFLSSARFCPVELRQLKLGQLGLSRSEIDLLPTNKLSLNEKTRLTSPLGYNSCPIRPSFTQPEDYRRQFLKFIGNTGLIQPKDIPINLFDTQTSSFLFQIKNQKPSKALAKLHRQSQPLDYISLERDTGFALLLRHAPHYQDSLTWHLEQEPLPMTLGSPGPKKLLFKQTRTSTVQKNKGVKELYFSESNWIAKEEKVKKILSQTGGGGLQRYLGLINVGQLVFILQNDLFEIAPRLARSQSARRILLQIVNETYNNLSQFILLLEKIQKNSLKKHNLKETLGFWSKRALGQNLDLTSKYAKVTTPKQDISKASKDTLSRHVVGLTHAHRAKGLLLAKTTAKPLGTNFLDSSTNPLLEEFPEQIDKIKQIIKNKIENLEKKYKEVKKEYKTVKKICTDFQNRKNAHKRRYKLAFQLFRTTSNPAGMTLSSIPVLPPGLRPIIDVPKIGPITADLNIRYRGLIFALRNLRELAYVDFRNAGAAQASVQEAVDDLLYTGGKTRKDKGVGLSPPNLYKSLAMRLKGKHGRFRGNLLGKRVDYSGRSVIVVGPTLKIHQCGLPFEIALKLFNPFLIRRLIQKGLCKNVYKAKQILIGGKFKPLIWALCREVMLEHLVLLNRAPTLHRLGVQAFIPILISGRAILLHPLVCTGFNADFDGDQMGVHVPLFPKARAEAWKMMWSRNNFLSPSSGEPILLPSQDMVLGCYYLTEMYSEKLQFNTRRSLKKNLEVTNFAALLKKGRSLAPRSFGTRPLGKGHNLLNKPKSLQSFSLVSTHFAINKKEKDLNFDFKIRKTTLKLALVTISKSLFSDFSLFQSLKNYKPRYIGEFFTFLKEPDFKIKTSTVLPIKYAGLKVSSSYSKRALAKGLGPLGQDQRAVQAFGLLPTVCYLRQPLGQTGRMLRSLSQGHRTWRQSPKAMLCNREIGLNFITLPEGRRIRAALRKNQQTYCYPRNGFKAAILWSFPKEACPKGPRGKATPFSQRDLLPLACYAKHPFSTKTQLAHSLLGRRYGNRDSSLIGNKDPKASFVYTQLIGSFWPLVYKSVFLNWTGYSSLTPSLKLLKNRGFGTIYEIKKQEEIHDKNLVPISEGLSKKLDLNNNENALYSHWSFGAALEFSSPWFVAQKAYPLKYNKSQKTKLCENVFCGAALGPKTFARSKAFGSPEHIQNLSAKIVVDRYYRGFYNLQSIVWVSLNLKKDLATNYFPEKTKNLENEGFLTPTLELRISPYGITHLLQISGSKKSLFYNSLLVPTKKTVKTPFEFSFIRTTVGRLLFNDILQKFEISLKGSS